MADNLQVYKEQVVKCLCDIECSIWGLNEKTQFLDRIEKHGLVEFYAVDGENLEEIPDRNELLAKREMKKIIEDIADHYDGIHNAIVGSALRLSEALACIEVGGEENLPTYEDELAESQNAVIIAAKKLMQADEVIKKLSKENKGLKKQLQEVKASS